MTFELAPGRFGRVPRHYVECTQDRAIDIATQRAMHAKMPCTVHTLDASHSPFFSMPDRLVDVLDARVARRLSYSRSPALRRFCASASARIVAASSSASSRV